MRSELKLRRRNIFSGRKFFVEVNALLERLNFGRADLMAAVFVAALGVASYAV